MRHHFTDAEFSGAPLVKSTDFAYQVDPNTHLSFLTAVSVTGYRKGADGSYLSSTMPSVFNNKGKPVRQNESFFAGTQGLNSKSLSL